MLAFPFWLKEHEIFGREIGHEKAWENHWAWGHRITSYFYSLVEFSCLFSCRYDKSKLFFEITTESTNSSMAGSVNQWLLIQIHCPGDARHCCISLSYCNSLQLTSQADHSRSTHPDKSCDQVQEGDGNAVLPLRLFNAHQQVSKAPGIHSLCTVKWARRSVVWIAGFWHEWEILEAQIPQTSDFTLAKRSYVMNSSGQKKINK